MGLSSTLVLANIALLFVTTTSNVMTFQEQSVIANTVLLVIVTLFLRVADVDEFGIEFSTLSFILIGINCLLNAILITAHWTIAQSEQARVHRLINSDNFAQAAKQLALL